MSGIGMKRTAAIVLLVLVAAAPIAAQSVGGGLSFWLPESQYLTGEGSVGVETALGSSLGLGEFLSLPFGLVYSQVYGLMPEIEGTLGELPWFYADSIALFLMGKVRLPMGPVYVDAFGGVNGVWHAGLRPLTKNIEADIAATDRLYTFQDAIGVEGGTLGWGWQAGGALGVTIDQISVDLNVTYRLINTPATITGTYSDVDPAAGTVTVDNSYSQELNLRLAGLSIGIDASFRM